MVLGRRAHVPNACLLSHLCACEFNPFGQGSIRPVSNATFTITEWEAKVCTQGPRSAVWRFVEGHGTAHFTTGNQPMTIEYLDGDSIAVRRSDVTGPVTGLTALYLGKIVGRQILGSVLYYSANITKFSSSG
jgi:hypothetical protein